MSADHDIWVDSTVATYGPVIQRFDPATQSPMSFHPRPWLKWNPDNADVAWALQKFPDGIRRDDLRVLELETGPGRRRAFVATLMWGAGTTNRYYGRHASALAYPQLDEVLEETALKIHEDDLIGAWSAASKLPGLDFRFFTKWLWLTGTSTDRKIHPLVFDNRVRDSLKARRWPWHARVSNDRQRWVDFCTDAAAIGQRLGIDGEWVEYWLFEGGPTA